MSSTETPTTNPNPILNHLPEKVVELATQSCSKLFSETCCVNLVHELKLDPVCMTLFATKIVGYGIIVAASAVKIPQVLKIFQAKSGAGITVVGALLELLAITFNTCYCFRNNFPFSAWGEAVFLAIETALIAFLVLWYDNYKAKAITFLVLYGVTVYALIVLVSPDLMWYFQSTVLYLSVSGKLFQAFKNLKAQHTGQISPITAWSILAGSVVRIFTTIQETGDYLTAVTFAAGASANAVIALQVLYYRKSTQKFLEKGRKKKAN